jgi:hypothetical protein
VTGAFDEMDLDDDEGFIDDDDDDEDGEMGEEEREQRRREKRRSEKQRRKAMDARPELAGIDSSAWDEIYDVFGNGDDYDWALDDDEEGSDPELTQKEMRYQDVSYLGPSLNNEYISPFVLGVRTSRDRSAVPHGRRRRHSRHRYS